MKTMISDKTDSSSDKNTKKAKNKVLGHLLSLFFGILLGGLLCLLLVVAVILEEDARPVGEGMPHEYIIIAEGLHVDAPFVPFVGNAPENARKGLCRGRGPACCPAAP